MSSKRRARERRRRERRPASVSEPPLRRAALRTGPVLVGLLVVFMVWVVVYVVLGVGR